jgi:Mg-chelatase subunit ChlD
VQRSFSGKRAPQQLSFKGAASQFAARQTIARSLRHYDPLRKRLVIERPRFHVNTRRVLEPWQVLLLVDQSGSMVGSVIHAAVTAACLWGLPGIKTHLIAFDTEVVDLSDNVTDPVKVLMGVQLGGGTFIGKAVGYAADRIEAPRRAIVVVISDFYEGMSEHVLIGHVRALVAQGTQVLGLAALDEKADPVYDRALAAKLVEAGAHVGAMTPGQLAAWLAEKLK